jgi:coenzyme PQQ precursor peptide PqqA
MPARFERSRKKRKGTVEPPTRRTCMQWTTPSFTDMRFGFEITMYIATR